MLWKCQALPAVDASQVGRSFNMSDGEIDEAGVADGDNAGATARLDDGAAAGLAVVAAAGAGHGEVALAAAAGSQALNACCTWQ
jgi:hypothetical protein